MDADMRLLERAAAEGDRVAQLKLEAAKRRLQPMDRWFLRCGDCLSVVAVERTREQTRNGCTLEPKGFGCAACGGTFRVMGRVAAQELVNDEERCPCDERCTHASGPKCTCACGAKNHGTGIVVVVTEVVGAVPQVMPIDAEAAKVRAGEYRTAKVNAQLRVNAMPNQDYWRSRGANYGTGSEDDARAYRGLLHWQRALRALGQAAGIQVHKLRMARLAAVAAAEVRS